MLFGAIRSGSHTRPCWCAEPSTGSERWVQNRRGSTRVSSVLDSDRSRWQVARRILARSGTRRSKRPPAHLGIQSATLLSRASARARPARSNRRSTIATLVGTGRRHGPGLEPAAPLHKEPQASIMPREPQRPHMKTREIRRTPTVPGPGDWGHPKRVKAADQLLRPVSVRTAEHLANERVALLLTSHVPCP